MTDRYPMPYMRYDECQAIGLLPYAVYGGNVYSFKDANGTLVPHGTQPYKLAYEEARAYGLMRMADLAGARGA